MEQIKINLDNALIDLSIISEIPLEVLKGECRKREVVLARLVFYVLADEKGYSNAQIAAATNQTHGTVNHGFKTYKDLFETNLRFRETFTDYYNKLKPKFVNSPKKPNGIRVFVSGWSEGIEKILKNLGYTVICPKDEPRARIYQILSATAIYYGFNSLETDKVIAQTIELKQVNL